MCQFTMTPGSSSEVPAQWGGPITFTAAQPAAFAPGPAVNPNNKVVVVCGSTEIPLTVVTWTPDSIVAALPSSPADCQQPAIAVTSGAAGVEQTCSQPLFVGIGGPSQESIGNSLEAILARMVVQVPNGAVRAGDAVGVKLVTQPRSAVVRGGSGSVLDPGTTGGVVALSRGVGARPSLPAEPVVAPAGGGVVRPPRPDAPVVDDVLGGVFVDDTPPPGEPFSDSSLPVPMTIRVRWEVLDDQGRPRRAGHDFEVRTNSGQSIQQPDILIAPPIAEFGTAAASLPATNQIVAHVTLTATPPGGQPVSRSASTSPTPVALLPIPLPTVAAFFRHEDFRHPVPVDDPGSLSFDSTDAGAVVVALPQDSGVTQEDIGPVLRIVNDVRTIMDRLRTLASIAELLTGVELLSTALSEQALIQVRIRNQVGDMSDIIWQEEEFATIDTIDSDLRAGDRVTSMLLVGLQGRRVDAFQHDSFGGMRVTMAVTGPAGWIALRDLRERATFKSEGSGAVLDRSHPDKDFNDRMSSYRWA